MVGAAKRYERSRRRTRWTMREGTRKEKKVKGEREGRENAEDGMKKGNDTELWHQKIRPWQISPCDFI